MAGARATSDQVSCLLLANCLVTFLKANLPLSLLGQESPNLVFCSNEGSWARSDGDRRVSTMPRHKTVGDVEGFLWDSSSPIVNGMDADVPGRNAAVFASI